MYFYPNRIKYKYHASKLRPISKVYWKIFIYGYLMYMISNDHLMSMNKALPLEINIIIIVITNLA